MAKFVSLELRTLDKKLSINPLFERGRDHHPKLKPNNVLLSPSYHQRINETDGAIWPPYENHAEHPASVIPVFFFVHICFASSPKTVTPQSHFFEQHEAGKYNILSGVVNKPMTLVPTEVLCSGYSQPSTAYQKSYRDRRS